MMMMIMMVVIMVMAMMMVMMMVVMMMAMMRLMALAGSNVQCLLHFLMTHYIDDDDDCDEL